MTFRDQCSGVFPYNLGSHGSFTSHLSRTMCRGLSIAVRQLQTVDLDRKDPARRPGAWYPPNSQTTGLRARFELPCCRTFVMERPMDVAEEVRPDVANVGADSARTTEILKRITDGASRQFVPFDKAYVGQYNPRPADEVGDLAELAASLAAVGCMQKPLARPVLHDGVVRFEIVYGQRRFLAGQIAFAHEGGMEMDIKEMSDTEAVLAAQTENYERKEMGPVAEAEAAAEAVAMFGGDRSEAAKALGWKLELLNSRLKLMSCSDAVRKRLAKDERFPMSIAELLAALKKEEQDEMLAEYDRLNKPSTEEFKKLLMQRARPFVGVIFDKSDCATCAHNSAIQRSMFETGLDEGNCLNASCYDAKAEAALQARADVLRATYQTVRIIRVGEIKTIGKVSAETVGAEQYESCTACASYGAAISDYPDSRGKANKNCCFDLKCNSAKVAAHAKFLADQKANAEPQQQGSSDARLPSKGEGAAASTASKPGKQSAGKTRQTDTKDVAPPVSAKPSAAVLEYRNALYRTVIAKEVAKSPIRGLALLTSLIVSRRQGAIDSSSAGDLLQKVVPAYEASTTMRLSDAFAATVKADGKALAGYVSNVARLSIDSLLPDELVGMVGTLNVDWNEHFKLSEDFFSKLTKMEAHVVAKQVGLDKAIGDEFEGLIKLKNADLYKKLTTVDGFKYEGAIPPMLKPDFKSA